MTTLIVPLPLTDQVVAPIRAEHDWSAGRGVPAHITLFGPFVSPAEVTSDLLGGLRELFELEAAPLLSFGELRRLKDVACLLPAKIQLLARLTGSVGRLRPDLTQTVRRYHLTVARACDDALFAHVTAELQPHLPLAEQATGVRLVERHRDGTVGTLGEFAFAG